MTVYVFVDLDDTLFNSDRKAGPDRQRVAAVDRQGAPLSFQSVRQARFMSQILGNGAVLVPTTGRNEAALRRVVLDVPYSHAICSFGGLLIGPDGQPEPRWHSLISAGARRERPALEGVVADVARIAAALGADVRHSIVSDAGLGLYVSIKHNSHQQDCLAGVADELGRGLPDGWYLHLNGNNLAAMPGFLGKANAVRWYLEHLGPDATLTVGVGDSFTDLPFMALCDYAITPTAHSQIFDALKGYAQ
jgi:hydroxymethylpyrimidine pyrophosphatase-like HAD family hydrolase